MEYAYLITENTNLENDFTKYDRLYIGDQFCEHNFMYFLNDTFIKKIFSLGKKITLTLPVMGEDSFILFKQYYSKINDIVGEKPFVLFDEIVVNDYGALNFCTKKVKGKRIIWGNFLSGQSKDPYLKGFKDRKTHKSLSIDNSFYSNLFIKEKIQSIELFNVYQGFDLTNSFDVNLYFPYVVYSINRYCTVNIIKNNIDYVTILDKCDGCKNNAIRDLKMNLKNVDNSTNYYIGNKQFYENKDLINNNKIKRIIYNYDLTI